MTDKFKQYLSENYDRLSPEEPGERVWRHINRRTTGRKGKVLILSLRKIAAVFVIAVIGAAAYFLFVNPGKHTDKEISGVLEVPATDSEKITSLPVKEIEKKEKEQLINSEIKKTNPQKKNTVRKNPQQYSGLSIEQLTLQYESSFTRLLESEKMAISTTPVFGAPLEYFDNFIKDFRLLESDEYRIKEKIRSPTGSIDALDEMIINFQKRIDLLKRLKEEIKIVNKLNGDSSDAQINYVRII